MLECLNLAFRLCRKRDSSIPIDGSDRGSNFYKTKYMDCGCRCKENRFRVAFKANANIRPQVTFS